MRKPTVLVTLFAALAIGCAGNGGTPTPGGGSDNGSGGSGDQGGGGGGGGGAGGAGGGGAIGGGGSGGGGGGGTTGGGATGLVFSPYKDTSINMNWNTNVISTSVSGTQTALGPDLTGAGGDA